MGLFSFDHSYRSQGREPLAGVDEVGRGCLAGPVFAAAVILPSNFRLPGLDDSKKLLPAQREKFSAVIREQALAFHVAMVSVEEIDQINILRASLKAMRLAVLGLSLKPVLTLVDGHLGIGDEIAQEPLIGGDARSASVAAASVVAKVARDAYMALQETSFPGFSFAQHKGYATPQHYRELETHGPTSLHRKSFYPISQFGLFSD
jgi:ribonuclease HII